MDKRYLMLIDALGSTERDLARLLRPLSETQARVNPQPDVWCVKDVVAHLGDIEPQFRARLRRIVNEDNPREAFINPNPAAHDLSLPVAGLIGQFTHERARTVAYLQTLTQPQWLRTCTHATFGVTRLRKQVEILIGHDNEHLAQIVEIREALDRIPNSLG